ncbi:DUF5462 family protein, partial [Vibrio sp. 10N.222.55.F8]
TWRPTSLISRPYGQLKTTYPSLVLVGLLVVSALSHAGTEVQNQTSALGAVNGVVSNHQLVLEETLSNPIVFSAQQTQLDAPLTQLWVAQATLIDNSAMGEVNVRVASSVGVSDTLYSQYALELWLDGKRTPMQGRPFNGGVLMEVPTAFSRLEVRVVKPVTMRLPQHYRGGFTTTLDITGR